MRHITYVFFIISFYCFTQEGIKVQLIDSMSLKAASVFGIDTFETIYYADEKQSFYKKSIDTTISYANFQLGKITSANVFNPLKINLFVT